MRLTLEWISETGDTIDRTVIGAVEPGQTYDASAHSADGVHVRLDVLGEPAEADELDDPLARLRSALGPINATAHTLVDRIASDLKADELAVLATAIERAIRTRSRAARMNGAAYLLDQPGLVGDARRVCEWLSEGGNPDTAR